MCEFISCSDVHRKDVTPRGSPASEFPPRSHPKVTGCGARGNILAINAVSRLVCQAAFRTEWLFAMATSDCVTRSHSAAKAEVGGPYISLGSVKDASPESSHFSFPSLRDRTASSRTTSELYCQSCPARRCPPSLTMFLLARLRKQVHLSVHLISIVIH